MTRKRILVVGGTGYLGQHLLRAFSEVPDSPYELAFTYRSNLPGALLDALPGSLAFRVDLQTGGGLDAVSQAFGQDGLDHSLSGHILLVSLESCYVAKHDLVTFMLKRSTMSEWQPDVVVNCAALSVPRACEADPAAAMSINVPSSLLEWLSTFKEANILLIHLSTDQVYEGVKSFYKEEDETISVNVYGKSKVAAEQFISKNWSNFAILRSSIIFGPQTISPVPKSLPIQWIDGVLSKGDKAEFFHDEFRCPVYVKDVVTIIQALTSRWISDGEHMQLLLNVGGPDRVSRAQMAEAVAHIRGYSTSLITLVSASSVVRGVRSPADISMDITRLIQTLRISPTPFKEGVRLTLEAEGSARC